MKRKKENTIKVKIKGGPADGKVLEFKKKPLPKEIILPGCGFVCRYFLKKTKKETYYA